MPTKRDAREVRTLETACHSLQAAMAQLDSTRHHDLAAAAARLADAVANRAYGPKEICTNCAYMA